MKTADFSKGRVSGHIIRLAIPLMAAQFVQIIYNLVDRIYIGHLPEAGYLAMAGLGLCFPVISLIAAFTNLFSTGGTPLFSIARGEEDEDKALAYLNITFICLVFMSIVLSLISYIFLKEILFLFGASESSYPYARDYMMIYLAGTPLLMIATGMNSFISAQGYAKTGMMTTLCGAGLNLILDPLFIFTFQMGIQGAALATVLSQLVSFGWVILFLLRKNVYGLNRAYMKLEKKKIAQIINLGMAGFVMQASNFIVQLVCNRTVMIYGQELYVSVMTLINSVREMFFLPAHALASGSQPVLGYNYGAHEYQRVWQGIRFSTLASIAYTTCAWAIVFFFTRPILSLFSEDPTLISASIESVRIYFFGFFMMSFQTAGQSVFVGLNQSHQAIFFSIFRKVIIVTPLTLLLPVWMGIQGVFWAEPISNFIGGLACYLTMILTMKKLLKPAAAS